MLQKQRERLATAALCFVASTVWAGLALCASVTLNFTASSKLTSWPYRECASKHNPRLSNDKVAAASQESPLTLLPTPVDALVLVLQRAHLREIYRLRLSFMSTLQWMITFNDDTVSLGIRDALCTALKPGCTGSVHIWKGTITYSTWFRTITRSHPEASGYFSQTTLQKHDSITEESGSYTELQAVLTGSAATQWKSFQLQHLTVVFAHFPVHPNIQDHHYHHDATLFNHSGLKKQQQLLQMSSMSAGNRLLQLQNLLFLCDDKDVGLEELQVIQAGTSTLPQMLDLQTRYYTTQQPANISIPKHLCSGVDDALAKEAQQSNAPWSMWAWPDSLCRHLSWAVFASGTCFTHHHHKPKG